MGLTSTVIMASYNGSEYIYEQLQSIFEQTVPVTKVLIRDDRSSDDTATIVEDFIRLHGLADHWDFQINPQRKGWRENFIDMLAASKTDVIFYSDQDDIWWHDKVAASLASFAAVDEMEVLVSDYEIIPADQKLLFVRQIEEEIVAEKLYKIALTLNNLAIYRPGCGMALRSSIVKSTIDIFREITIDFNGLSQTHDQAAWLAAIIRGSLYHLHESLFIRRIRADSTWQMEKRANQNLFLGLPKENPNFIRYLSEIAKHFHDDQSEIEGLEADFKQIVNQKIQKFGSSKNID
ncbi:hypothetical protein OAL24_00364 [Oenococcus sicerae]|nr:hypothetical protein OAL24_00364 [Oenococcus sicerae]